MPFFVLRHWLSAFFCFFGHWSFLCIVCKEDSSQHPLWESRSRQHAQRGVQIREYSNCLMLRLLLSVARRTGRKCSRKCRFSAACDGFFRCVWAKMTLREPEKHAALHSFNRCVNRILAILGQKSSLAKLSVSLCYSRLSQKANKKYCVFVKVIGLYPSRLRLGCSSLCVGWLRFSRVCFCNVFLVRCAQKVTFFNVFVVKWTENISLVSILLAVSLKIINFAPKLN